MKSLIFTKHLMEETIGSHFQLRDPEILIEFHLSMITPDL